MFKAIFCSFMLFFPFVAFGDGIDAYLLSIRHQDLADGDTEKTGIDCTYIIHTYDYEDIIAGSDLVCNMSILSTAGIRPCIVPYVETEGIDQGCIDSVCLNGHKKYEGVLANGYKYRGPMIYVSR